MEPTLSSFQTKILQKIKDSVDASKRKIEFNSDGIHIHSQTVYISVGDDDSVWCFHIKENKPKRVSLDDALIVLSR